MRSRRFPELRRRPTSIADHAAASAKSPAGRLACLWTRRARWEPPVKLTDQQLSAGFHQLPDDRVHDDADYCTGELWNVEPKPVPYRLHARHVRPFRSGGQLSPGANTFRWLRKSGGSAV